MYVCVFVCQGSVAIAGAAVAWLRDNIGIIQSLADIGSCSSLLLIFTLSRGGVCLFVSLFVCVLA